MTSLPPLIARDLESGGTLVVPTPQRAAAVQLAYARTQLTADRTAWRTPRVLGWRAWLEREAARAREGGALAQRPLNTAEEWLLWRRVAAAALDARALPFTESLVQSLRRAAQLLCEWHIPVAALGQAATPESELLAATLLAVDAQAAEHGGIASHRFATAVRRGLGSRPLTFAGFLECSAARRALLSAGGGPAGEHALDAAPAASRLAVADDEAEELGVAAAWCRAQLQEHPERRLLVIVPDLAARHAEVLRAFHEELVPASLLRGPLGTPNDCVSLEGGQPLTDHPLVRDALRVLELLCGDFESASLSLLLRSPFWPVPDPSERALLDASLRRCLPAQGESAALLRALRQLRAPLERSARDLAELIERGQRELGAPSLTRPICEWAARFTQALSGVGWPGSRALSSAEQQTQARWLALLAEWRSVGAQPGLHTAPEALRVLARFTSSIAFAPASGDTAVTVSSQLVAPIVRYDGVWVTGLHAEAWPPPPRVEPFIPLALQRAAAIPAASPGTQLEQSRELLRILQRSTPQLVLSWAQRGAERPNLPSPLLTELAGLSVCAPPAAAPGLDHAVRAARRIERFGDAGGLAWPAARPLPAGTRALDYQSRCPFRAYAELRLDCTPLEIPRPGVDPRERGQLLHRALELLWKRLHDSQTLHAQQATGGLGALIHECVAAAATLIWPREDPASDRMSPRVREREMRRAGRLLAELAELERQRPPFQVLSLEQRARVQLDGIALDLRIDRIDRLQDGRVAIFDYKTGNVVPPDWHSERPTDPQLLVYGLAQTEPVAALALVQLSPRHVGFRGQADEASRLPRLRGAARHERLHETTASAPMNAWHAQLERWRATVVRLAREFASGSAAVDPLDEACDTCHLHAVCRIGEITANAARPP